MVCRKRIDEPPLRHGSRQALMERTRESERDGFFFYQGAGGEEWVLEGIGCEGVLSVGRLLS
jgi:hypothetical protein